MNIELFLDVMEDEANEIVVEREGVAGRDRALAEPFDVILLDLQLPGLRGDAICTQLRAHGLRTSILALTAQALPWQVAHGLSIGFSDYLTKPLTAVALRKRIKQAAEHSRSIA